MLASVQHRSSDRKHENLVPCAVKEVKQKHGFQVKMFMIIRLGEWHHGMPNSR